jgi:deoxyribodipyrimidine photolyase-related protein
MMSEFLSRLNALGDRDFHDRQAVFVPYDQLNAQIGPLADSEPKQTAAVFVETTWKSSRRPYHKQKLAWVLANQRHFALELARKGYAVDYRFDDRRYDDVLRDVTRERGPLKVMEPAEAELRRPLDSLVEDDLLEFVDHQGWLTTTEQFRKSQSTTTPWRMDAFYRHVRRDSGLLMEQGRPLGGRVSFDAQNRRPWNGEPPAPEPPRFEPDPVVKEVGELIETRFADHPGKLDLRRVAATADQAQSLWNWAKNQCMTYFGPFEDAMSKKSTTLFHTMISPLLNLGRLLPQKVVDDVVALDIPLNSKEGFLRQVLGWREFMRHVYWETDGFRSLPDGYGSNFFNANLSLPSVFWGKSPSGLDCLDEVVRAVVDEGYSHHITRPMVLSNLATLLDISPREITDWFWVMYIDAFDWVVEPNVLGMGIFALGDLFTTKPYVSGSNYIDKMSDFCATCTFDPRRDCPIRFLYWAFLGRHEEKLKSIARMGLMLSMLDRRREDQRKLDREIFDLVSHRLANGRPITADDMHALLDRPGR